MGGGKPENPEKNPWSAGRRTDYKLNPHVQKSDEVGCMTQQFSDLVHEGRVEIDPLEFFIFTVTLQVHNSLTR